MIAGALLIVAASVFYFAALLVSTIRTHSVEERHIGYIAAGILGVFGLSLLLIGLIKDRPNP
jgi:hypothetical protein